MEWNFPNNNGGQIRGIEDAGIRGFTENELMSLAREICQNSLDAMRDEKENVIIQFDRHLINTKDMPGYEDYKKVLTTAEKYWSNTKSDKAKEYLSNAVKNIKKQKSYVLRISDYKTKGLSGPYDEEIDNGWNSITKTDGGATKSGDSAGSYGIGKNAPFANSHYRLVFYRTINEKREEAVQGISRLISFPTDFEKPIQSMTTGIGYFGNSENNKPVPIIENLNKLNIRNEVGTDVFIYGFRNFKDEWYDEICIEILNNFMMSLYMDKMSVVIEKINLNKNTLNNYMEKYKSSLNEVYSFYLILKRKEEVTTIEKEFHGLGTLKLSILIGDKTKLNRKILVTRKSGMKLFSIMRMPAGINFTGILEVEGEELNKFFREMETPAHDKWEPNIHSNPKKAKEYYSELKKWIKNSLLSLVESTIDEEIEVEGLGGILQNEYELQSNEKAKEVLSEIESGLIITMKERKQERNKGLFFGENGSGKNKTKNVAGDISKDGKETAVRKLSGTRKRARANKEKHFGVQDKDGKDIVHKNIGSDKAYPIEKIRIIKMSSNSFKAILTLPKSINSGYAEILAVGENNKFNRLKIISANAVSGCENVEVSDNKINFSIINKSDKISFNFTLVNDMDYAMEVNIYEYN